MANYCVFCANADNNKINEEKERWCSLLNIWVPALKCCPGWKEVPKTPEQIAERERILALSNKQAQTVASSVKPAKQSRPAKQLTTIETDHDMIQDVRLYEHQIHAREKFKDLDEIALFFEMGCGKTLTSMMIMCDKYKAGKIDSLLVVAPNDVHKQWFDDLCNDDSTLSKAIKQEGVECDGQILGGRGGQKEFYDFDYDKKRLHIVCVNIDTFSQPHKWEPIVEWANAHETAIIIDEATVIKNPTNNPLKGLLVAVTKMCSNLPPVNFFKLELNIFIP